MIEILYEDKSIVVCVKPAGTLSEIGGGKNSLPEILSAQIHSPLFTVHRLDREVSGVMVYAKNSSAAARLCADMSERRFGKEYLAVIEGAMPNSSDTLTDLLFRDSKKNKTYTVSRKRQGVKEASLEYTVLAEAEDTSLLKIILHTGRTHQIRVQFASRKHPIVGDRKYGSKTQNHAISLCSHKLSFNHPLSNKPLSFTYTPENSEIWNIYANLLKNE